MTLSISNYVEECIVNYTDDSNCFSCVANYSLNSIMYKKLI